MQPTIAEVKQSIRNSRKLSEKVKNFIVPLVNMITRYKSGIVTGLNMPEEIRKRSVKSRSINFGASPDGYFVHTHRARSKSKKTVSGITKKEIDFVESTG